MIKNKQNKTAPAGLCSVISPLFIYLFLMYLFYLYPIHAPHGLGWVVRELCLRREAQGARRKAKAQTSRTFTS